MSDISGINRRPSLRDRAAALAGDKRGEEPRNSLDAKVVRPGGPGRSLSSRTPMVETLSNDRSSYSQQQPGAIQPRGAPQDDGYMDEEVAILRVQLENAKRENRNNQSVWEEEMMKVVTQLEIAQGELQGVLRSGGAGNNGELARLQQQLANEAEDTEELSRQMVALDSDHQKLSEQLAALTDENTALKGSNRALQSENTRLQSWAGAAETGHVEGRHDAQALVKQLEEAGDRLEKLLEDKEDLEIKCKELELQVTVLEEALATGGQLVVDHATLSKESAGDPQVLMQQIVRLEQERERLVDMVEEKEIRNTELLIEIETLEEEILTLVEKGQ
jgi:chromosome segregation ATPase